MNQNTIRFSLIASVVAISISLAGCFEKKEDSPLDVKQDGGVSYVEGKPGLIAHDTATIVAKVASIDYKTRELVLQDDKGGQKTVIAPKEVVNFDQIKKGDRVSIKVLREMIVNLSEKGAKPTKSDAGAVGARAAEGEKPGMAVAKQVILSAKVVAVDEAKHTATLKFEDGTQKVFPVRKDVKLNKSAIGREVVILVTEAMAISVEEMPKN